jgi:hypothetical protein
MEPEGSLPCSLEPDTGPYPESDKPNPHPLTLFPWNPFQYCPPIYTSLRSGLFPSAFPTKILYAFHMSSMRSICPDHLILLDLIILIIFGERYIL